MEVKTQVRQTGRSLSPSGSEQFHRRLNDELSARMKKNPRYSMRAFAQLLELHPSTLSQILTGRRSITRKTVWKIGGKLGISENEMAQFTFDSAKETRVYSVEADMFSLMADWYHLAILESTSVEGFELTPENAARFFNISVAEADAAIERLKRLQLLQKVNGKYAKTKKFLTNLSSVNTSAAHKQLQRQIVGKALHAIDEVAQHEKDITSMTFAIDESRLSEAKEMIKNFRRSLGTLLGGKSATRVYKMGIQLFPVSESLQPTTSNLKGAV